VSSARFSTPAPCVGAGVFDGLERARDTTDRASRNFEHDLNRLEKAMDNAVQTRQRMLALALPLAAALYIGADGLNPKGADQIVTTTAVAFKVLPIAANHSTQLYASGSLSKLALGPSPSRMPQSPCWSESVARWLPPLRP
jgi:hypothetical protein